MTYHILNGDALLEMLPASIPGERLVARECLLDGPVHGNSLAELYQTRATFLQEAYGDADYETLVIPQFQAIQTIPAGATVNLWFEDDLFCQVNLWFVLHLLHQAQVAADLFLVRPPQEHAYGFGGLQPEGLPPLLSIRQEIPHVASLAPLWEHYQQADWKSLAATAEALSSEYPFLLPAVEALLAWVHHDQPTKMLVEIAQELGQQDFPSLFRVFVSRGAIYGFGDLQVKRLYDELLDAGRLGVKA